MSRVDPLNRQTSPSSLALSQQQQQLQQQQQVSQSSVNANSSQTGAAGTLVQGPQLQDTTATAAPTKKQLENRLDSQLANQLPTTPPPSASQKDPTGQLTNASPAPDGGLDSQAGRSDYSPDKALASNLAKDLSNTDNAPQLPEPADPQTSGTQNGLDPRLQAEINLARGRAHDSQLNQNADETLNTLGTQDVSDNNLAQLLSKPPENTPEAPVATAPETSAFDNQHPRGDPRGTQPATQAQTGAAGSAGATPGKDAKPTLDPQHPSAMLLADSKLGAARLAALLTPAALQREDAAPARGKAATAMMGSFGTEGTGEATAAEAMGPQNGLPGETHTEQATVLARANTAAEAAAILGAERAAMLLQALSAAGQPLVAVVWTDIFRMQQARLDQLTANRGVDEDGEMAPTDSEEAIRRQRRIQSVDLSGTSGRGTAPGWDELLEEEDPLAEADVWFRAALLATALQRPQIVTRMFRATGRDEGQKIRFFRRDKASRFLEQWHALSEGQVPVSALPALPREAAPVLAMAGRNASALGTQSREQLHTWMEAAERAYAELRQDSDVLATRRGAERSAQALEMIHGRDAVSVPVTLVPHEAASMWGHIIRTNPPYDEPVVATTTATAIDGLLPDHAYAVLGTFRRGPEWMVALCNPAGSDGYSEACGIFGLPFATLLKNASELTMLRKVRG